MSATGACESVAERPVSGCMESPLRTLNNVAAATLEELASGLDAGASRTFDLGTGHMTIRIEQLRAAAGSMLLVGHYFEGGSRRGGSELLPAPEMVFVRTSSGWSPASFRNALDERLAIVTHSDAIEVDESVLIDLVLLANAWLSNVQDRLVIAARRAA